MPRTKVLFYQERKNDSPVVEWLRKIRKKDPKGFLNCLAKVEQLQTFGYELRRRGRNASKLLLCNSLLRSSAPII